MRRVSIVEIMQQTGLSRATIDRVLNGRGRVHARTKEIVEQTLLRLSSPETDRPKTGPKADIVLRLGHGMLGQMQAAWSQAGADGAFCAMYQADEPSMIEAVGTLCEDTSRPIIVATMNTSGVAAVLRDARRRGKIVISMIADLSPDARDFHVGIDDRAAGRTAAFLVGSIFGDRPTTVGVVVGDVAYRNHEDREIGFRTGLRTHFPKIVLAGEAYGGDNVDLTFEAVSRLLGAHPALCAIYNVGGANMGLANALKDSGRSEDVLVIGHEVNAITAPLLQDGTMNFSIATDPSALLARAFDLLAGATGDPAPDTVLADFAVYTRFNLPSFAHAAGGF